MLYTGTDGVTCWPLPIVRERSSTQIAEKGTEDNEGNEEDEPFVAFLLLLRQ